jgi:multidrug efflux pump
MTLALTSDTMQLSNVEDLADTILAQKISQLSGVGLVSINGGQKPAVRIQINPLALAAYGLSLEGCTNGAGQHERGPGEGEPVRHTAGVYDWRE